jgi:recombination protein RecT
MSAEQFRNAVGTNLEPVKDKTPTAALFDLIDKRKDSMRALLPKSVDIEVFVGVVKTAVLNNPDLVAADQKSFFVACLQCAQRGLMPDGKESVLNVYNTNVAKGKDAAPDWRKLVSFQPMWTGLVKKMYESGEVSYVDGAAVYEGDHFEWERGENPKLIHKPTLKDAPGQVIAAYVVIKLKSGEVKREVLARRDIEKIRSMSKSPGGPGWGTWYDQFAIKAAGKRAAKLLPMTPTLQALRDVVDDDNKVSGNIEDLPGAVPALENNASAPANFTAPAAQTADPLARENVERDMPKRKHRKKVQEPAQPPAEQVQQSIGGVEPTMAELRFSDFQEALKDAQTDDRRRELLQAARSSRIGESGPALFTPQQIAALEELATRKR